MDSILDEINKLIISDYKSGNSQRRVLLQTVKAAILQKAKDIKGFSLADEQKVLSTELKQRIEARDQYLQNERQDLVEKMDFEINVLKDMAPKQLPEEEIERIVQQIITSSQDKSFPAVMRQSINEIAGKADGSTIAQIVKRLT
jgi:uncharacterized protein YqeY